MEIGGEEGNIVSLLVTRSFPNFAASAKKDGQAHLNRL